MTETRIGTMTQLAAWPGELQALVDQLRYKPGWEFRLQQLDRGQGSEGLTLVITITALDTNDPSRTIRVAHYMIVPAAAYKAASWRRWLLDQILLVEQHEACEFLEFAGDRAFAPNHGQGEDPYRIVELTTQTERSKTFRD